MGTPQRIVAKAEGSRGGHVIGHSRSGKPVYATGQIHGGTPVTPEFMTPRHGHVWDSIDNHHALKTVVWAAEKAEQGRASNLGRHGRIEARRTMRRTAHRLHEKYFPSLSSEDHKHEARAHLATLGRHTGPDPDAVQLQPGQVRQLRLRPEDLVGLHYAMSDYVDRREKKKKVSKSAHKGEGSHGGHIIGHTRSGKPIYSHDHQANSMLHPKDAEGWLPRAQAAKLAMAAHPGFSRRDHIDAMEAHQKHYRASDPGVHGMAIQRLVDAHSKAFDHLARKEDKTANLEKSAQHGEGSHGGHVIGHTRSGKPIYSLRHDMNRVKGGHRAIGASHELIGYTPADFGDAAAHHMQKFVEHRDTKPNRAQAHLKLARHLAHNATVAINKPVPMHMSGLSPTSANHASLAAFHLREAEAKRADKPAEALWHYGQVGLHSSAAIAGRQDSIS